MYVHSMRSGRPLRARTYVLSEGAAAQLDTTYVHRLRWSAPAPTLLTFCSKDAAFKSRDYKRPRCPVEIIFQTP